MDPKETLRQLRRLAKLDYSDAEDRDDALNMLDDFSELFQALDQWMSGGGFSPWEVTERTRQ